MGLKGGPPTRPRKSIGGLLREAKLQLRHGKWLPWLTAEFDFSERTAQNYMRAHKFATKNETVADLQLTPTALYFLSEGQRYFNEETSRTRCAEYTADEIALVLKEAADLQASRHRAHNRDRAGGRRRRGGAVMTYRRDPDDREAA